MFHLDDVQQKGVQHPRKVDNLARLIHKGVQQKSESNYAPLH